MLIAGCHHTELVWREFGQLLRRLKGVIRFLCFSYVKLDNISYKKVYRGMSFRDYIGPKWVGTGIFAKN